MPVVRGPKAAIKRARPAKRRPGVRLVSEADLPDVIPPRSVVILRSFDPRVSPEWKSDLGRAFRVGYYNRKDGLECVWLVNERGEYEQTTDRTTLLKHFFLKLSDEDDLFGDQKPPLKPLAKPLSPLFTDYVASAD